LDGTVSYYADDASVLPPNAPIATGKQAIRGVWATLLTPDTTVSWEVTKADAARSGELAYVEGVYQITARNPKGKSQEDKGKLVEVWKKQADGKWKVVTDIFNSDMPLPAPPAGDKKK
jgi:ketosteroid isomerase-like protein